MAKTAHLYRFSLNEKGKEAFSKAYGSHHCVDIGHLVNEFLVLDNAKFTVMEGLTASEYAKSKSSPYDEPGEYPFYIVSLDKKLPYFVVRSTFKRFKVGHRKVEVKNRKELLDALRSYCKE